MWINLSGTVYFFGSGGVIKIEELDMRGQAQTEWKTTLIGARGKIGTCKESVSDIEAEIANRLLNEKA